MAPSSSSPSSSSNTTRATHQPASQLLPPISSSAASHREAPLISLDPTADISDFFMFRSYEPGQEDKIVLIMDVIPGEEPSSGPNYWNFDPTVLYSFNIDNDRDGEADDVRFEIRFTNEFRGTNKDLGLFLCAFLRAGMATVKFDDIEVPSGPLDEAARLARFERLIAVSEKFLEEYERCFRPVNRQRVALVEALELFILLLHAWTKIKVGELDDIMYVLERFLPANGRQFVRRHEVTVGMPAITHKHDIDGGASPPLH